MPKTLLQVVFVALVLSNLAAAQTKGEVAESGHMMIYFERLGTRQGRPLVVINGGPGFDHTYLTLSPVWGLLSKMRPVILYDQRGNGKSSRIQSGDSCTLQDQIDDLEALRKHLGSDEIDLVGHSWGGFLGMAYAAKYPQHVVHLILVDSAPARWSDIQPIYQQVFPDAISKQRDLAKEASAGDKAAGDAAVRAYLSTLFYSPTNRDAFLGRFSADGVNNDVMNAVVKDIASVDLSSSIRAFRFPTLIVNGRFDTDITPAVASKLHQIVPYSTFVIFEQSGHFPFYEEPERFVRVVRDFLGEH